MPLPARARISPRNLTGLTRRRLPRQEEGPRCWVLGFGSCSSTAGVIVASAPQHVGAAAGTGEDDTCVRAEVEGDMTGSPR